MHKTTSFITLFLLLLCFTPLKAQLKAYKFEEVDSLNSIIDKKVVVFTHTTWCKYCLQMENTTLQNDSVISLLNQHFYFVSFDAESKENITFLGKTFKYKPNGQNTGIHELAKELATINGKINFPTVTILQKNNVLFQWGGLMNQQELLAALQAAMKQ